jgi:hypothetical protein
MVIRTEYRGERYSMGSSDPFPAGFEIRFGSLNFQATGERLPYAHHQSRRAPSVAADRTETGPYHAYCCHLGTRTAGHCGPFSTPMPTPFWPALTPGVNGTMSGHACRGTT